MAKTKAEAVKVRVVVFYDDDGTYMAGGNWDFSVRRDKVVLPSEERLLELSDEIGAELLPYTCIVDIELPIPKAIRGKVLKVKAVKT